MNNCDGTVDDWHQQHNHCGIAFADLLVHGKHVTCPLHNWNIELETGEVVAPDEACAAGYPTKVKDGVVFISL